MLIEVLTLVSFALWLIGGACLVPSLVRSYRVRPLPGDDWRSATLYAAGLFCMFNLRRLFAPGDMSTLTWLYLISIGLASYVLLLLWNGRSR